MTFLPSAPSLDVFSPATLFLHHSLNVTLISSTSLYCFILYLLVFTFLCFNKCSCLNIIKYLWSISQMKLMSSLNLILLFAPQLLLCVLHSPILLHLSSSFRFHLSLVYFRFYSCRCLIVINNSLRSSSILLICSQSSLLM